MRLREHPRTEPQPRQRGPCEPVPRRTGDRRDEHRRSDAREPRHRHVTRLEAVDPWGDGYRRSHLRERLHREGDGRYLRRDAQREEERDPEDADGPHHRHEDPVRHADAPERPGAHRFADGPGVFGDTRRPGASGGPGRDRLAVGEEAEIGGLVAHECQGNGGYGEPAGYAEDEPGVAPAHGVDEHLRERAGDADAEGDAGEEYRHRAPALADEPLGDGDGEEERAAAPEPHHAAEQRDADHLPGGVDQAHGHARAPEHEPGDGERHAGAPAVQETSDERAGGREPEEARRERPAERAVAEAELFAHGGDEDPEVADPHEHAGATGNAERGDDDPAVIGA